MKKLVPVHWFDWTRDCPRVLIFSITALGRFVFVSLLVFATKIPILVSSIDVLATVDLTTSSVGMANNDYLQPRESQPCQNSV